MTLLPRWIRALVAWRIAHDTGGYVYFENTVTGARRLGGGSQGHQSIDRNWLGGGEWNARSAPPTGGSSVTRPA